jgi:hypothetical protein
MTTESQPEQPAGSVVTLPGVTDELPPLRLSPLSPPGPDALTEALNKPPINVTEAVVAEIQRATTWRLWLGGASFVASLVLIAGIAINVTDSLIAVARAIHDKSLEAQAPFIFIAKGIVSAACVGFAFALLKAARELTKPLLQRDDQDGKTQSLDPPRADTVVEAVKSIADAIKR